MNPCSTARCSAVPPGLDSIFKPFPTDESVGYFHRVPSGRKHFTRQRPKINNALAAMYAIVIKLCCIKVLDRVAVT